MLRMTLLACNYTAAICCIKRSSSDFSLQLRKNHGGPACVPEIFFLFLFFFYPFSFSTQHPFFKNYHKMSNTDFLTVSHTVHLPLFKRESRELNRDETLPPFFSSPCNLLTFCGNKNRKPLTLPKGQPKKITKKTTRKHTLYTKTV